MMGNNNLNVLPAPNLLLTPTLPLWASITFFTRLKPRPVPLALCTNPVDTLKNLSNIFFWSIEEIPIPLSVTSTNTKLYSEPVVIVITLLSLLYLTALSIKFIIASDAASSSIFIFGRFPSGVKVNLKFWFVKWNYR